MSGLSDKWQAIQEKYSILEQVDSKGFALITSKEINKTQTSYPHLKFEARLLTHFDNAQQQPDLFLKNSLSILPYERGSYIIGRFNIFMPVPKSLDSIEVRTLPAKVDLFSLQEQNLANESMGLNYAFAHGITADFAGEPLTASVAGRQNGGNWSYKIESGGKYLELQAKNPQIEIDAGYEGESSIVLIEAKNSLVQEFCLRQLYFPYRCWLSKSKETGKTIKTFFAAINGGEIFLHEYVFPEPDIFKAELTRSVRYQVATDVLTAHEVRLMIETTPIDDEPASVPFPQANSIIRTIDAIEFLATRKKGASRKQLAEYYGFNERQADYYGNSAIYLGFAERITKGYQANDKARAFVTLTSRKDKNSIIIGSLLKHAVFRELIIDCLNTNAIPTARDIAPILMKYRKDINETTVVRRSSTIRNWLTWIMNTIQG